MDTYKNLKVGQTVKSNIDYYDYKILIPKGTVFNIISFPPFPMKQGSFVYGRCELGSIRLNANEVTKL